MTFGVGIMKAGVGPYGLGTPVQSPVPGGKVFVDENGNQQGARYLNAVTGDAQFDSHGRYIGMLAIRQLVQLRIKTVAQSAATLGLGNRFGQIQRISDNYVKVVDSEVRRALSDLVTAGLIVINDVTVTRVKAAALLTTVNWTDTSNHQTFNEILP